MPGPVGPQSAIGASGYSGASGFSGVSGFSGANPGTSGYSGASGASGKSGFSGISGMGTSGTSGFSGASGSGGGITNTAPANTVPVSDGINLVPSPIVTSQAAAGATTFNVSIDDINAADSTPVLAGAGAGNVSNGTHRYKFLLSNISDITDPDYLSTGGTGTASAEVTVTDNSVDGQVTVPIPVGCDRPYPYVQIYRDKDSDGVFKYVGSNNFSCQNGYTDNVADGSLGATIPSVNTSSIPIGFSDGAFRGTYDAEFGYNVMLVGAQNKAQPLYWVREPNYFGDNGYVWKIVGSSGRINGGALELQGGDGGNEAVAASITLFGGGSDARLLFKSGAGSRRIQITNGAISEYNNSTPADGELLVGKTSTGTFEKTTLTAGAGITITPGAGAVTIASNNSGFTATCPTGNATLSTATGTVFISPASTSLAGATEANVAWVVTRAGTIRNLYVRTGSVAKVNTPSTLFTVRKNGVDTGVTLTMTETTTTSSSDTTHSFTVAAGDIITISVVTTGALAVSTSVVSVTFQVDPI